MDEIITQDDLQLLTQVPEDEKREFKEIIKHYRYEYIKPTDLIVEEVFNNNKFLTSLLKERKASEVIIEARELVWQSFLINESVFNTKVMKDLSRNLSTPRSIIDKLIDTHIVNKTGNDLLKGVIEVCGEYSGRVYPYIYELSLSNTQSRRSRAGSTFENIIYKVYSLLQYPFDSQRKVGKTIFQEVSLGKLVDSILPDIEAFSKRRDKVVIGTMKTSLRERWQEVSEEIQRTNIPKIYLLTVDDKITLSKAKQMSNHNIIVVAPIFVTQSEKLKEMRNIISFEDYLFEEIPNYLNYWNKI
ncbi:MAG: type II restriction endonuclease [Candidatus Dojkabacteria bacterium]